MKKIKGLSLFSNVGIAELLLSELGIDIVIANEINEKRAKFYKYTYPDCNVIIGDIKNKLDDIIKQSKINNIDFIIATPPCQGFSNANTYKKSNDVRNDLIYYVIKIINELKPNYIIIENVPQFLKHELFYNNEFKNIVDIINEQFSDEYNISINTINASDYGIPQNRKRSIILMNKLKNWEFPKKEPIITVRDVIGYLPMMNPKIKGEKSNDNEKYENIHKFHYPPTHSKKLVEIMKHTPTGKSALDNKIYYPKNKKGYKVRAFKSSYKRMEWDKPSFTITTNNGSISSQNNVHPGRPLKDGTFSDPRVLTIYELMKLSTIPDNWNVPEWATENFIRKVIGEGIPPLLIYKICKNIIY